MYVQMYIVDICFCIALFCKQSINGMTIKTMQDTNEWKTKKSKMMAMSLVK